VHYLHQAADELTRDEWRDLLGESGGRVTKAEWEALYDSRREHFQYVHLYYYLRKQEE
jgi:hypothetical protein